MSMALVLPFVVLVFDHNRWKCGVRWQLATLLLFLSAEARLSCVITSGDENSSHKHTTLLQCLTDQRAAVEIITHMVSGQIYITIEKKHIGSEMLLCFEP